MTNRQALDALLSGVETQLDAIAQALGGQDPDRLEAGSKALRDVTLQLTRIPLPAAQDMGPDLRQRVQAISARLAVLRESLQRLAVQTERAVTTLLPRAGDGATYGKSLGRGPAGLAKAYKS